MSQRIQEELRFVTTAHGTHFAWRKHSSKAGRSLRPSTVGMLMAVLGGMGAITWSMILILAPPSFIGPFLLASLLVVLLGSEVFGVAASKRGGFHHVTFHADGIEVGELPNQLRDGFAQPSVDRLREAGIPEGEGQRYPYVDIESMGVTDYSFWLKTDHGETVEWRLDCFSRAEIARIHDAIEPHWRAKRDRSTAASGQQLAALHALRQ